MAGGCSGSMFFIKVWTKTVLRFYLIFYCFSASVSITFEDEDMDPADYPDMEASIQSISPPTPGVPLSRMHLASLARRHVILGPTSFSPAGAAPSFTAASQLPPASLLPPASQLPPASLLPPAILLPPASLSTSSLATEGEHGLPQNTRETAHTQPDWLQQNFHDEVTNKCSEKQTCSFISSNQQTRLKALFNHHHMMRF